MTPGRLKALGDKAGVTLVMDCGANIERSLCGRGVHTGMVDNGG
jgi:hypothetical protein